MITSLSKIKIGSPLMTIRLLFIEKFYKLVLRTNAVWQTPVCLTSEENRTGYLKCACFSKLQNNHEFLDLECSLTPSPQDSRNYIHFNYFFDFSHIFLFDLRGPLNFHVRYLITVFFYLEILIFFPHKLELFYLIRPLHFSFGNHRTHFCL